MEISNKPNQLSSPHAELLHPTSGNYCAERARVRREWVTQQSISLDTGVLLTEVSLPQRIRMLSQTTPT